MKRDTGGMVQVGMNRKSLIDFTTRERLYKIIGGKWEPVITGSIQMSIDGTMGHLWTM